MIVKQAKENLLEKQNKEIRAGETWSINDSITRGHKSTITNIKNDQVKHIPRTHSPKTRKMRNIKLQENPAKNKGDNKDTYILPKVQITNMKYVGKKHIDEDIKNPVDKSIIRHLKKEDKKINKKKTGCR